MRWLLQTQNFSPICVSISIAANLGWSQYPVDVKNAFLCGTLKEKLYMSPSPKFVCKGDNKKSPIKLVFYALKQSNKQ